MGGKKLNGLRPRYRPRAEVKAAGGAKFAANHFPGWNSGVGAESDRISGVFLPKCPMSSPKPTSREVSLGNRPKHEPEFIAPGEPQYGEIARLDALTFKRYLDRVFWHPRPEVLRFEVRANPSPIGSVYDVVAIVGQGEGDIWFADAAVPARWDYVAITETSDGLGRLQREKAKAEGKLPQDYRPFVGEGPVEDYSKLENPEEVEQRRWAVVNRIREANRRARQAAARPR
ncbi:hypothetical protein ACIP1U_16040 [Cupriavidus sp. NPDC089707]|uniref:hypothetical protein n=1 Tax=Cupriavidus sp. NPDC089707 TaxID=3363963 RepID=UPI0038128330